MVNQVKCDKMTGARKFVLLLCFLLLSTGAQSQVLISLLLGDKLNSPGLEFGLEGGFNWSTLGGMQSHTPLSTFNLGFYFDIQLKNQWYLNTGVLVKSKLGLAKLGQNDLDFLQTETYTEQGDYHQVINYFLLPVLGKYKFKEHLYLETGPQFGLMHKAYVEYISDVDGIEARIRETNKDDIHRIDAGLMGGIGYTFIKGKGLTIGLKFYYGLTNVYKERTSTGNRSLFLKFNIPIGAAE